jgi:GR25 family glycosyltransferase involved in LPS biosynthesis
MKGYVITISDVPQSVQVAKRCIKSAQRVGFEVQPFWATSPRHGVEQFAASEGIPTEGFEEVYSRYINCLAAFCSHYRLWQKSVEENETLMILEHDAYFLDQISDTPFRNILSFGRPSYGKFVTPPTIGKNKLISKQYLPGAHAYAVTPAGAAQLIAQAKVCAKPTDVFICNANFDNIEEYYPWPVEVRDSFTTIQKERGCLAKHNYNETYEVI